MKNMPKSNELDEVIDKIEDVNVLKGLLKDLYKRIDTLEQSMVLSSNESNKKVINNKVDRLNNIKHGITELTDRMLKPYIMPSDLQVVVDTLDVLGKAGDCNSLIIEGKPGTGKTQLAYHMAKEKIEFGSDCSLIHLKMKNTLKASELLYSVDDTRRLKDSMTDVELPEHIREESAIWLNKILNGDVDVDNEEYLKFRKKSDEIKKLGSASKDLDYSKYVDLGELGEAIYQSQFREVVLIIDEIEKGDESLMTGILDEIENLEFRIRETGQIIRGKKENLKIIITTNTEDSDKIPSSFRRRSLYHYQNYPTRKEMYDIVNEYFPNVRETLMDYALDVFYQYHENDELKKQPSTPELLSWIKRLSNEYNDGVPDGVPYKHILLKYKEDQDLNIQINGEKNIVSTQPKQLPSFVKKAFNGETVYFLDKDRLNDPNKQDELASSLYKELEDNNIPFITPIFEKKREYDNHEDDWVTLSKCIQEFKIIAPGVQYLGDGDCVINNESILKIFKPYIIGKTVESKDIKFESILEKNSEFTFGTVYVDGQLFDAYKSKKNKNKTIILSNGNI